MGAAYEALAAMQSKRPGTRAELIRHLCADLAP